jgi:hypothetical protein
MPFGGWLDDYYSSIYCRAIQAEGLEPHRADDLFTPSTITNDIWNYTKKAKLLIADLTGKNPNVFYELGLAHALGKPVILISESLTDIPFDLRALRIIIYDKNAPNWGDVLKGNIQKAIAEVLKAPVSALLPAFLDVTRASGKPSVSSEKKDLLEIKQELDLVRRELSLRSGPSRLEARRYVNGPDEARQIIRDMLAQGASRSKIMSSIDGPPRDWILDTINEIVSERDLKPGSDMPP